MEVVNFSYYFQGKEALRDKNLIASTPQLFPGAFSSRSQNRTFVSLSYRKSHIAIGWRKMNPSPPESRKPHQTYRTAEQKIEKNRLLFFCAHSWRWHQQSNVKFVFICAAAWNRLIAAAQTKTQRVGHKSEMDIEVSTCEVLFGKVKAPRINQVRAGWDRSHGRATPSPLGSRKHTWHLFKRAVKINNKKQQCQDDLGCVFLFLVRELSPVSEDAWLWLRDYFYSDELKRKLILSFVTGYCLWAPPNNGESFWDDISLETMKEKLLLGPRRQLGVQIQAKNLLTAPIFGWLKSTQVRGTEKTAGSTSRFF